MQWHRGLGLTNATAQPTGKAQCHKGPKTTRQGVLGRIGDRLCSLAQHVPSKGTPGQRKKLVTLSRAQVAQWE